MASETQELQDTFQTLYNTLTEAYWVASTLTDKDRIRGSADAVYDILTTLTRREIKTRGKAYTDLKQPLTTITARLQKLQADIDLIIHNVAMASRVTGAIAKAVTAAS